jgi:hypothetical protein
MDLPEAQRNNSGGVAGNMAKVWNNKLPTGSTSAGGGGMSAANGASVTMEKREQQRSDQLSAAGRSQTENQADKSTPALDLLRPAGLLDLAKGVLDGYGNDLLQSGYESLVDQLGISDLVSSSPFPEENSIQELAQDIHTIVPVPYFAVGLSAQGVRLGNQATTTLWRAVKPEELIDIRKTGVFRNLGGAEGKYFSTTAEGAASYARQAVKGFGDPPYTIVRTEIATSTFRQLGKLTVDRNVPAIVVPQNALRAMRPEILDYSPLP